MRVAGRRPGLIWFTAALALLAGLTVAGAAPGVAGTRPARGLPAAVRAVPGPGLVGLGQRPARLPGGVRRACSTPAGPGQMQCLALLPAGQHGGARPDNSVPDIYDPADLQSAYNLVAASAGEGGGETVAVVDAYNDPHAAADLAAYRSHWGQPACDQATGAGCVTVVSQHGAAGPLPAADPSGGWEVEESLDMEMVSAICPNCHILLVEANSAAIADLGTAEDTAVRLGAKFVSDSWGENAVLSAENNAFGGESDDAYFDHPGVAITVAGGDYGYGYGTSWPASTQFVTSVGGTTLVPAPGTARGWTESAWSGSADGIIVDGTGSGCASDPDAGAKPAWQAMDDNAASGCQNRTDNDVSAVADPNTPVWYYDSYPYAGQVLDWNTAGGTSVASPIVAAVYALAGTPRPGTYPASYLYQAGHAAQLYPVTSGFNGYCKPAYLCNAAADYPGTTYNGPAGWGTPDGTAAFTDTATGTTITVTDPGSQDVEAGTRFRLPATAVDSAAGHALTFSAAGLPAGLSINPASGLIAGRLPAAPATSKVTITATDTTGATGSVSFNLVTVPDLRAGYHTVTGPVTLWVPPVPTLGPPPARGMCLEDAGNSAASGARVEIWKCNHQAAQQWTYLPDPAPDSSGTLVIHGKCATITGPRHGRRLRLEPCTGAGSQGWSLQAGAALLYNPASGLCMNDTGDSSHDGTQIGLHSCGSFGTLFVLPPGPVLSGTGGQCLADPRNSRHAGTSLGATRCDGSRRQLWSWSFVHVPFTFPPGGVPSMSHDGLCPSTTGVLGSEPGIQFGAPVRLHNCSWASDQEPAWSPLPDGQIINSGTGLCLDNPGGAAAPAARLVAEPCIASAGEIWAEG